MLEILICPNAKLGHFLILNTDFWNLYLKIVQNGFI